MKTTINNTNIISNLDQGLESRVLANGTTEDDWVRPGVMGVTLTNSQKVYQGIFYKECYW